MTRDEIIAMAKKFFHWNGKTFDMNDLGLVCFANMVAENAAAAERDALASLKTDALVIFAGSPETSQDVLDVIEWYDAAIRARGEK